MKKLLSLLLFDEEETMLTTLKVVLPWQLVQQGHWEIDLCGSAYIK